MFLAHFPLGGKSAIGRGLSARLSVNTTPPLVLSIPPTPVFFFIKFRSHGTETLRKENGTFLNWKSDNELN